MATYVCARCGRLQRPGAVVCACNAGTIDADVWAARIRQQQRPAPTTASSKTTYCPHCGKTDCPI